MSASSPATATAPSSKRPLEDPSSDADAKRPALGKNGANGTLAENSTNDSVMTTEDNAQAVLANGKTEAHTNGATAESSGATATNENTPSTMPDVQPIQSSVNETGHAVQSSIPQKQDESQWLHMRSIISSQEAATLIGKGGENVTQIRKISGARCTVSDYSRGAVERVLTVSGVVDAVGKAFGLIIRTLNNESLEGPSTPQSKMYPLRLLIPHILVGAIIGQKGVRIREIQEASGARLNASESCLPLSTERSLVVLGVADAVHIATYYISQTLVEQLTERFGGPAASSYATRQGGPAGAVPGGMQVVPYQPQPAGGQWGHPDTYNRGVLQPPRPAAGGQYGAPQQGYQQPMSAQGAGHMQGQTPLHYQAQPRHGYTGAGPQAPSPYGQQPHVPQQGHMPQQAAVMGMPGQAMTQQIYIPNDMVGAIIGKGGAKINEIRQLSGSVIKINEPQDNSNERLVTITGTQECNQMALYMLYQRLENEKHRI